MLKYIVKRILLSALILLGVSLIIYVLVRIQPGENFVRKKYAAQLAQDATGDVELTVRRLENTFGLDVSPVQGYVKWLGNVLQGDWGDSFIFNEDSGKKEKFYTSLSSLESSKYFSTSQNILE